MAKKNTDFKMHTAEMQEKCREINIQLQSEDTLKILGGSKVVSI